MFQVFCTANIFLGIVIFKMIIGDQESLSYANCQLTNTCFGRTTDDLANERSLTPITDKETTSNTQTSTLSASENASPFPRNTQVSLHTRGKPSRKDTCIGISAGNFPFYTTKPNSTVEQLTKVTTSKSQITDEVTEEATVAMTTVDSLKSTNDSKPSEVYTKSSVWVFNQSFCYAKNAIKVKDLIYVLCVMYYVGTQRMQYLLAYEDRIPRDLLMLTIIEEIKYPINMVAIENTNTFYVHDRDCKCIWKIDMVNSKVNKWLPELGYWSSLSLANDNHLLVLKDLEDLIYLEIFDQDANLVRSVSLSTDFKGPLRAIQKPNGEFIVSHRTKENNGVFVSFLSADGQIIISQFGLKETIGFKDVQLILDVNLSVHFATEMFSGNVYFRDWETDSWNLTDYNFTISNDSEESSRQNLSFKTTDGRIIIKHCWFLGEIRLEHVQLFWDAENDNLLASGNIFDNIYLFDTKTLKWSHMGQLPNYGLFYDTKEKQFITLHRDIVHILTLSKN